MDESGRNRISIRQGGMRWSARIAIAALAWIGVATAAFSPGDLPGLVLWLDAGDAASIVPGERPEQVLAWRDKSPAAHRAAAIKSLEPPIRVPTRLNGHAAIRFNGKSALLLGDSKHLDFQGTDDITFFVVINARSNGSILARSDARSMQYRFHVPGGRTLRVMFGRGGRQADTTATISPDTFRLLSVVNAGGDGKRRFTLRVDGRDEGAGVPGTGRSQAQTSIGGRNDGKVQRLNFDLAEMIVFRRALADAERDQVENYLRTKFALDRKLAEQPKKPTEQPKRPVDPGHTVPLADAPEGTFALAVIPDTQRYHGPGSGRDQTGEPRNPAFASRVEWLAGNLKAQRIAFVSHAGDIVDRNNRQQWALARGFMDRFHGQVPYGISVGNHDMTGGGNSSLFQEHFGAKRFADMPWYGGTYGGRPGQLPAVSGNNANSWQTFSAGGLDFVIVHMECNAPDDVLAWVDGVLSAQRKRLAIITTHMYLGGITSAGGSKPQGRMKWRKVHGKRGNTPQQIWEKCFAKHPNLFLVLCGDQSSSITHHQTSRGEHGNAVHEVLQDYPRTADDADWLRVFRFHPKERLIRVFTYSPAQKRLAARVGHAKARGDHQFELDIGQAVADHLRQRGIPTIPKR